MIVWSFSKLTTFKKFYAIVNASIIFNVFPVLLYFNLVFRPSISSYDILINCSSYSFYSSTSMFIDSCFIAENLFGFGIPTPNFVKRTLKIWLSIFFLYIYWTMLRSGRASPKIYNILTLSYNVLSILSEMRLFFIVWFWNWLIVFPKSSLFLTPNEST